MMRLLPVALVRFARRLRFPQLFLLTALLFVVDLFVPDVVPFVDELLLGLGTLLLGAWRRRRSPDDPVQDAADDTRTR